MVAATALQYALYIRGKARIGGVDVDQRTGVIEPTAQWMPHSRNSASLIGARSRHLSISILPTGVEVAGGSCTAK